MADLKHVHVHDMKFTYDQNLGHDLGFEKIDGPIALSAGTLLFGDLFDILGRVKIPARFSNEPFILTQNGNVIGVVGRSIDQPTERSCILKANNDKNKDVSTAFIPEGQEAEIMVMTISARGEPLPCSEHDLISLRLNGQEMIGLC